MRYAGYFARYLLFAVALVNGQWLSQEPKRRAALYSPAARVFKSMASATALFVQRSRTLRCTIGLPSSGTTPSTRGRLHVARLAPTGVQPTTKGLRERHGHGARVAGRGRGAWGWPDSGQCVGCKALVKQEGRGGGKREVPRSHSALSHCRSGHLVNHLAPCGLRSFFFFHYMGVDQRVFLALAPLLKHCALFRPSFKQSFSCAQSLG